MADPDARTANLLGALAIACGDVQRAVLSVHGMEGATGAALLGIHARSGSNIGDIAQTADLTHSGAVRAVSRLEKLELIERRYGEDRRTVQLHCTAAGTALSRRLLRQRRRALERLLDGLSEGDRKRFGSIAAALLSGCPRDRADAWRICRLCDHGVCRGEDCPVGSAVQ